MPLRGGRVRTRPSSHFQPRRGRKSAVDIVLPFPIEGQAFNGDPIKEPRNDSPRGAASAKHLSFRGRY